MTDNEIIKSGNDWHNSFRFMELVKLIDNLEDQKYNFVSNKGKQTIAEAIEFLKKQNEENAELHSELLIIKNNFDNAKERYEEAVKIGQKMNEKLVVAYKKLQTVKTEAIKEFAERLKDEFVQGIRVYNGYASVKDISKNIDNLVKEMTGGLENGN